MTMFAGLSGSGGVLGQQFISQQEKDKIQQEGLLNAIDKLNNNLANQNTNSNQANASNVNTNQINIQGFNNLLNSLGGLKGLKNNDIFWQAMQNLEASKGLGSMYSYGGASLADAAAFGLSHGKNMSGAVTRHSAGGPTNLQAIQGDQFSNLSLGDTVNKAAQTQLAAQQARSNALRQAGLSQMMLGGMQLLGQGLGSSGLGSLGGGNAPMINFNDIQNQLNNAAQVRQDTFAQGVLGRMDPNYRAADSQGLISGLQDLAKGLSGEQYGALRSKGLQGINQQFLTSQNQLQNSLDRSTPARIASARQADLLKSNMQARMGLEAQLITDELNRRNQTYQLLQSAIGQDVTQRQSSTQMNMNAEETERLNRMGSPELGAQMLAQIQQLNQQAALQALSEQRLYQQMQIQAQQTQQQLLAQLMSQLGGLR